MSIADPGKLLVLLAFAFNAIAFVTFILVARGDKTWERLASRAYHLFTIATGLALAFLFYCFFSHQFALKYVHDYSDRSLSFFYEMAALWGGQEGTYLLWLFMNAVFGYIILRKGQQYREWGMVVLTGVNLFFLYILTVLSPFALMNRWVPDGAGLNPLLLDPWMVIHPPMMFLAYSMAAIPFAIAIAAFIKNDYSSWLKLAFPYVAFTALFLAAGNILGGFWAYKTLGWGGFWAWDPVENSSFIPWFVSLALIHGMIIERRSGAFRRINLLLTSFVFLLVVYGTFLTRSGVLSDFSVHSFVDLGLNNILVAFMAVTTLVTVALFLWRAKDIPSKPMNYNIFSKEFMLFGGMLMLFSFSIIVLFWTSLPVLTSIVGAEPRAADIATYNDFALPFGAIYALLLAVSPFLAFQNFTPSNWKGKLAILAVIGVGLGFGLFYFGLGAGLPFAIIFSLLIIVQGTYLLKPDLRKMLIPAVVAFLGTVAICMTVGVTNYMYILYFGTAAMAMVSNLISLWEFIPGRWKNMGGEVSHFGFGLMLIGILGSAAFSSNEKLVLPRGEIGEAFNYQVSYQGMADHIETPHNELLLTVATENGSSSEARPQLYWSERLRGMMKRPHIERNWLYDLYFAPEQVQDLSSQQQGLVLSKGESEQVGEYEFTFLGYRMGDSHEAGQGMRVVADVAVEHNGDSFVVQPAVMVTVDEHGHQHRHNQPAEFGEDQTYAASIINIMADQGAIILDIPGLVANASSAPDRLIIDVAKKPVMNLVWLGTILIMLGGVIVFVRRRSELSGRPTSTA